MEACMERALGDERIGKDTSLEDFGTCHIVTARDCENPEVHVGSIQLPLFRGLDAMSITE